MSKDKGSKEKKKAPNPDAKKSNSDYQNGKSSVSKMDIVSKDKKSK